jgi:hypothetical protein
MNPSIPASERNQSLFCFKLPRRASLVTSPDLFKPTIRATKNAKNRTRLSMSLFLPARTKRFDSQLSESCEYCFHSRNADHLTNYRFVVHFSDISAAYAGVLKFMSRDRAFIELCYQFLKAICSNFNKDVPTTKSWFFPNTDMNLEWRFKCQVFVPLSTAIFWFPFNLKCY